VRERRALPKLLWKRTFLLHVKTVVSMNNLQRRAGKQLYARGSILTKNVRGAQRRYSFYRAMHCIVQSAVLRSHVVCLSVCLRRWWIRTT